MKSLCIFLVLFSVLQIPQAESSKVLILIPLTTVSEKNAYTPLADALGNRGHQVTVVARTKSSYESPNVTEIIGLVDPTYMEQWGSPIESRKLGSKVMLDYDVGFNVDACIKVYENPNFQKLLDPNVKFDVIFTNTWFHQCLNGFIYKKKAPLIMVSTMGMNNYVQSLTGQRLTPSFVPSPLFSVSDRMSFLHRMQNALFEWYWTIFMHWKHNPPMESVYRRFQGEDLPSAAEIDATVSLIFQNTHVAVTPPRPTLPDVIDTAGTHCRPAKPLPKDLDQFLSGAEHGFIYFSMGSLVQAHKMPEEWRNQFINVFERLKPIRVLWKYESDNIKNLPSNVRTGKWLPQQDVIGHKNCLMFITHGGGFSTQEAVYHGVPLIGMPIYVDQNLNMNFVVSRGFGIELEILDLNEEILEKSINQILTNKSYAENAKKASAIFRDQPQSPLDRAVFWTEYVIRHKGAHHLRSAARDLNFFQYHSIDVILFLLAIMLLTTFISAKILACSYRSICKRSTSNTKKVKKQ